jgi:hypothetical protein
MVYYMPDITGDISLVKAHSHLGNRYDFSCFTTEKTEMENLTTLYKFAHLQHDRGVFLIHACMRPKRSPFPQHHLMEILKILFQSWMKKIFVCVEKGNSQYI